MAARADLAGRRGDASKWRLGSLPLTLAWTRQAMVCSDNHGGGYRALQCPRSPTRSCRSQATTLQIEARFAMRERQNFQIERSGTAGLAYTGIAWLCGYNDCHLRLIASQYVKMPAVIAYGQHAALSYLWA